MRFISLATACSLALLTGCIDLGGDDEESKEYSGYFLDSGVEQLAYRSSSFNDPTTPTGGNGQFSYFPGESTTFTFLGLDLGTVSPSPTQPVITPATLLGIDKNSVEMATFLANRATDSTAQTITNMLVLLQSFDHDQDPENGIVLPTQFDDVGLDIEYDDLLSDLNLSTDASTFSAAAIEKLNMIIGRQADTLISETAAIAHFIDTLEKLEAAAENAGRWGMRSGGSGDLGAIYTFNANGSVLLTEYEGCPDNLWGANEALLIANCSVTEIAQTIRHNGNGFELQHGDLTDTCLPLSIYQHESILACEFHGSGLGNEIIRLQRAPTDFTEAPLAGSYQTLEAGSSHTTTVTFTEIENGTNTGSDNESAFNWSTTDSVLSLTNGITEDFTFQDYIKGSWILATGSTPDVIFRSTDNITNANLLNQNGQFYGIFDVDGDGTCQGVIRVDDNYSHATQERLLRYENGLSVDYACDYPENWFDISLESEDVTTELVTFSASSITILGESTDRHCYLLGLDDYNHDTFYVACENLSKTGFNVEIWREL